MYQIQVEEQHLAAAERHVANGKQRLIWQRDLIAQLEQKGLQTS